MLQLWSLQTENRRKRLYFHHAVVIHQLHSIAEPPKTRHQVCRCPACPLGARPVQDGRGQTLTGLWQPPVELSTGSAPPLPTRFPKGERPSLPDIKTIRFRPSQFLEIVLNKKDSVSAAKDCSLFMEQEYVFRAKTFFDFSSR